MAEDYCLTCELEDCDEHNPKCKLVTPQKKASRRYYLKIRDDPEYKRKKREIKNMYLRTSAGKKKWNEQCKRYRKKYPEKAKAIYVRYHEKKKHENRLLETLEV